MTHQPTTVLIAEDDPVFRRVMGFSIARSGLTFESVGDGEAAYQRICQGGIQFLVTDHQMPICSGLELLEKLRLNQNIVRPPAILCTAKGLELDSQGLESMYSLVAVMHKPFSPRKLSELILQHIGEPGRTGQRCGETPAQDQQPANATMGAPIALPPTSGSSNPGAIGNG